MELLICALVSLALGAYAEPVKRVSPTDMKLYFEENLSNGSEAYLPEDSGYAEKITPRWNSLGPPTYVVTVKPATAVDVLQVSTLTIGGAVTFAQVLDPLYKAGKEIQTGFCSCVGAVGATLGAGVETFQGLHGLLIDALINDGQALVADYLFKASQNVRLIETISSLLQAQPDEFSFIKVFQWSADYEAVGRATNQPFLDLEPQVQDARVVPWNRIIKENRFGADAFGGVKDNKQAMYGLNMYAYDVRTVTDLFEFSSNMYQQEPDMRLGMFATEFNRKRVVTGIPNAATAFPLSACNRILSFTLLGDGLESLANSYALAAREKLAGGSNNPGLETYVNYAHGDEGQHAWYTKGNMERLSTLKKRWDPKGLFNFFNGILG
ncbi:unnamed protein product [Clonostachys solani]|uniref:Berberine/berberine-like domain-containing protein n=1 Tax=Clonostachys solani TaxID=160281 RepID=A0A9N9ZB24_9HYPO|nr:unnamed protein product [Clonostachys solani]